MSDKGYIKLDRKILEWRYFKKDSYLKVWMYLLLNANHKAMKWQEVSVKRGQLITSLENISKGTGVSIQSVRTILKKLEGQELTCKSTNKYTLITILKYNDYQDSEKNQQTNQQSTNKQLTNNQQTTNKQLTTNNNVNNVNNDKNVRNYYKNKIFIEDKLPTYDTSKNKHISDDEVNELLELMGKA